jgi:hypothetical protein
VKMHRTSFCTGSAASPSAGCGGAVSSSRVYVASGTPRARASAASRSLTCGETLVDKLTVCDMGPIVCTRNERKSLGIYTSAAAAER